MFLLSHVQILHVDHLHPEHQHTRCHTVEYSPPGGGGGDAGMWGLQTENRAKPTRAEPTDAAPSVVHIFPGSVPLM